MTPTFDRVLPLAAALILIAALLPTGCSKSGGSSAPPGFAITLSTGSTSGFAGGSSIIDVTVQSFGGFVDPVTLSVLNLPSGVTAVFSPAAVNAGNNSELTLTVTGSAALGTYNLTVRGTSGTNTEDAMLTFDVIAVPAARFTLSSGPAALALPAGTGGQSAVQLNPIGGFSADVTLTEPNPTSGLNVNISPATINATTPTAVITISPSPTLAVGNYTVTIRGVSGNITEEARVMVAVTNAGTSNGVTLSTPIYAATTPGNTTAVRLGVERAPGVTGSIALTLKSPPTGITAIFSENPCPSNGCLMTLLAAVTVSPGYYPLEIEATSGSNSGTIGTVLRVGDPVETVDAWVSRVEVAQTVFGNDVRLVAGKGALVRAHVLADRLTVLSPTVRLTATQGTTTLGTMALAGPTTLPTAENLNVLAATFNGTIPSMWVQRGVSLTATVDPDATLAERDEANNSTTIAPTVSNNTRLDLVIVPLALDGRTGTAPPLQTPIFERWPLSTVNISVRATYAVTTVAQVQSGGAGWTEVLAEVASLRDMDQSSANYYGVLDVNYSFGVAGIGYIGFPVSIGRDDSIETAIHELGHNFGLRHAPCGGATTPDPNYPYPNARAGSLGYSPSMNQLFSGQIYSDTMAYCSPEWISDYNYKIVHSTLAPNFAPNVVPEPTVSSNAAQAGVLIQGKIEDGRVTLSPPYPTVRAVAIDRAGTHWLTVRGTEGARALPFSPRRIGCGPSAGLVEHFSVFVPDVGAISAIEVDRGGRRIFRATDAPTAHAQAVPTIRLNEAAGRATLTWDATGYDRATLVHLGAANRTTLALWRRGGEAVVSTRDLPVGGRWEITLSKGLQTVRRVLTR